jgi:hypothetical protein
VVSGGGYGGVYGVFRWLITVLVAVFGCGGGGFVSVCR